MKKSTATFTKRSTSTLGKKLRILDRRLDLPPSTRSSLERQICAETLEYSLRILCLFMKKRAFERARMSGLSVQQRELLVELSIDPVRAHKRFMTHWTREIDQLIKDKFVIISRGIVHEPRLTKDGLRVAEQERQMLYNDELAALHGISWPKKQRARWAIEKLADVMKESL